MWQKLSRRSTRNPADILGWHANADRKKTIPFQGEPRLMRAGQTMTIGNTGTNEFMDGVIDDVRIWKQALTDEQVRKLIP